jgi:adenosylhomocysteinase
MRNAMVTITISNNDRAQRLYDAMISESGLDTSRFSLVVVQHVLPNTIPLFRALRAHFHIGAIIPKPRSIDASSLDQMENSEPPIPILHCNRRQLLDRAYIANNIVRPAGPRSLVLLDIGGYFAESIEILREIAGERLAGIVEDTENGHQKYDAYVEPLKQKKGELPCPVFSVARSPLKEPEDYLVGQAILYSAERVLREHNTLLTNKIVLVIGYGKIGKSIANSLAVRNVTVWVYDRDPIRCAQALAHGFHVPEREFGISQANLIIGATGNKSLSEPDFLNLRPYSFVCAVTSADDEFDFGNLRNEISHRTASNGTEIYYNGDRLFHLLNQGNAINFAHGAVLGTYIYLVACEIIACVLKIARIGNDYRRDRIMTLTTTERQVVADRWVREFKNADVR